MKTRKELKKEFDTYADGIIRSPGKFEGQPLYVPYFWEQKPDAIKGNVMCYEVLPKDKSEFPELKGRKVIKLIEDDMGFVVEV
jgi:hypothetical protein